MITQSKGKIFLSEERGVTELPGYRSYQSFNAGGYYNEHKAAFGQLCVLNEDTLAAGISLPLKAEENGFIVLIPVVGRINVFEATTGKKYMIEAGQLLQMPVLKNDVIEVTNPYSNELVKYLQLFIKAGVAEKNTSSIINFDLDSHRNSLVEIIKATHGVPAGFIGKFTGRSEVAYSLSNSSNGLFAFVIEGVFEVQHRLLQPGDSLGLWDIATAELEALSEDAIILIIETSFDN